MKKLSIILLILTVAILSIFGQCGIPTVANPVFAPAPGNVTSGQEITITCATEGATIRYTTGDGTQAAPTATTGEVYSATAKPTVTANITFKAIAVKDELTSNVVTAAYTVGGTGNAIVILNVQMDWGDGTGYQLLMDADHTAYGVSIPTTGPLTAGTIYDDAEYKIPADADYVITTTHIIVAPNTAQIEIPAGTYDWCIVNPTPGTTPTFWIVGGENGRKDDWVAAAGTTYTFTIASNGSGGDQNTITEAPSK